MSVVDASFLGMKVLEKALLWTDKIWPWIVIPTLIVGAMLVALIWGEAKKGIRS
jgi:hypothetical protein